ncbi:hypothetical protein DQ04_06671040 [Trypanosoma grayi]|uniref:hypothetical protein n=1 Tax=Trypanosoma grayi TaxID=71804 RepID=UPI0004F457AF|nr:hypothetical protein DQ04_06671040 [Trypanosoma grayi]KEG08674.1 hypothetical protein DQ04_06671040 [Trypanosoma grayi]
MPCVGQEPFNEATTPENPLLRNFAEVELSVSETANSDLDHPHESHHETPEQWEVRAPDTDDGAKSEDGAQCPGSRGEPFGDYAEKDNLNHPKADQVDAGSTAPDGCGVDQGLKEDPSLVQTKDHSLDAVEARLHRESSCSLDRSVGPLNDTVAALASYQVNAKGHSGSGAEDAVLQHSGV